MRKPYSDGGLPRLKVRGINQRRGMGQRPMALSKANAILDGFGAAFSRFLLGDIILPLLTSHVFLKNWFQTGKCLQKKIRTLWQVCMMPWKLGRREVDPLWWSFAAVWDWRSERHYETFKTGVSMKLKPYMKPFGQILKIGRVDGHWNILMISNLDFLSQDGNLMHFFGDVFICIKFWLGKLIF